MKKGLAKGPASLRGQGKPWEEGLAMSSLSLTFWHDIEMVQVMMVRGNDEFWKTQGTLSKDPTA